MDFDLKGWEEAETAARKKADNTREIAYRACQSANPEHPELVAQSIPDMYKVLKNVHKQLSTGWIANDCAAADRMRRELEFGIKQILNQMEGK